MPRHILPRSPSQPDFIEQIEQLDDVRIVRLCGLIDQNTVTHGYDYILKLQKRDEVLQHHLLLDCTNIDRIDLSAIALLVVRMHDYLKARRRIALMACDTKVQTYIDLAELSPGVDIYDTEQEAIEGLREARPAAVEE